ncbi:MAG: hypothetical protein A3G83_13425 [Betaproteobacteria bacterium RIFCSPLOWO2_12_FULL_68_20]|nr:MAG: hypothetical protein A3G83_13425 [Betaproteobacteria bacterium RIFCSPLOWO2_12_FULL_68_20]
MPEFRRPPHRRVAGLLRRLDPGFMRRAECYFGGGTQLVMQYGEYRVSEDIDLLCSSRAGWRMLRETVTQRSLGRLFARPVQLEREVRADRDAIRTFLRDDAGPIKLEIIVEARIDLAGATDARLGVPVLDPASAAAEKFLANTDRGTDELFRARDLIDLAFLANGAGEAPLREGLSKARAAYGAAVSRELAAALRRLDEDRAYYRRCIADLAVNDEATLRRGLRTIRALQKTAGAPRASRRPRR